MVFISLALEQIVSSATEHSYNITMYSFNDDYVYGSHHATKIDDISCSYKEKALVEFAIFTSPLSVLLI